MTFIAKRRQIRPVLFAAVFLFPLTLSGQVQSVENSIFFEVSGNGLRESSFLFGSHHLLGSHYVDSLENVNQKFSQCKTFVSETFTDSSDVSKVISAAIMKDTILQHLISDEWYLKTEQWLMELSGNAPPTSWYHFSPVCIELMIVNLLQIQLFGQVEKPMDSYLEEKAKLQGKKAVALEPLESSLDALFHASSYRRQAERLVEAVGNKELVKQDLILFNQLYRAQNITALEAQSLQKYSLSEIAVMLDNRNNLWMTKLPALFSEQSTFVVIGALHLTGPTGLVTQLRKLGYNVTPISIY
jgi:uncharacterized protein